MNLVRQAEDKAKAGDGGECAGRAVALGARCSIAISVGIIISVIIIIISSSIIIITSSSRSRR